MKESDRLSAMIEGLTACGINAYAENDDMIIEVEQDICWLTLSLLISSHIMIIA